MRILISHVFGYANKGDWALLEALLHALKETFPTSDIRGVCRDPASQAAYFPGVEWYEQLGVSGMSGLRRRLDNVAGISRGMLEATIGIGGGRGAQRRPPRCFRDVDLVVACPGGYLEDSNASIITNLTHLWMGIRSGAPVVLAPQSIGPFRKRIWRRLAGKLLSQCHDICVREELSRAIVVNELKVAAGVVHLMPDMAFYDAPMDMEAAQQELDRVAVAKDEEYACATVIDWSFPFSEKASASRARYVQAMAKGIQLLRQELGCRTVLVKQVARVSGLKGDDAIMAEVANAAGSAALPVGKDLPPSVMRGIMKRSAAFIGSRMHSAIFALQTGTPTVAISYLPKTVGVMRMLGLEGYVCDIETLTGEGLCRRIVQAVSSRNDFDGACSKIAELGAKGRREFQDIVRAVV